MVLVRSNAAVARWSKKNNGRRFRGRRATSLRKVHSGSLVLLRARSLALSSASARRNTTDANTNSPLKRATWLSISKTSCAGRASCWICSNAHCDSALSGRQRRSLVPRRKRLEVTWLSFWELSGVEFCPLFGVLWVPLLQPHFRAEPTVALSRGPWSLWANAGNIQPHPIFQQGSNR